MRSYLDFEKPVAELEAKLEELRALGANHDAVSISDDIGRLEAKASAALEELYATLSPWQKTLVARHPERPHFLAYCNALINEFTPLAGDRKFGEDEAIVGGFGRFRGIPSASSARRRAIPRKRASGTISAWRDRKATARRRGSWSSPTASQCRCSPSSTRPAPIRASRPRSAARPRPSPALPKPASRSEPPTSRW